MDALTAIAWRKVPTLLKRYETVMQVPDPASGHRFLLSVELRNCFKNDKAVL